MKRKVLLFGKIAYRTNRKENEVEIDMEISVSKSGQEVLTICGIIWNRLHTNEISCGQNIDTIKEYVSDSLFNEIYNLWKKYQMRDSSFIPEKDMNRIKEIITSC